MIAPTALILLSLALAAPAPRGHGGENPSLFTARFDADMGMAEDFTVDASFESHLPLLVVENSASDAGDAEFTARLNVYNRPDAKNILRDAPQTTLDVLMRKSSNPSAEEDKANYHVELLPAAGAATPARMELAGLPEDSRWLLRGSVRDKSMLRNGLAYRLGRFLFPNATPEFRYCEVLFKRGDRYRYEGIHILAESEERIFASLPDRENGTAVLRFFPGQSRRGESAVRAGSKIFSTVQEDGVQQGAGEKAEADLARLEDALRAVRPAAYLRYQSLLDQDSLINLYILNMLMLNADESPVSFYLYSGADGKFRLLPDWTFDEAVDNRPVRNSLLPFEEDFEKILPPSILSRRVPVWRILEDGGDIRDLRLYPLYQAMSGENFPWFDRLFLSRSFLSGLYKRYHQTRSGPLAPAKIRATLNGLALELGPAIERDWVRWRDEYVSVQSRYALQPFIDEEGREHIRQTWSLDQELVKINHCMLKQDDFIRDQLERLNWMTADLYDKSTSGNRQAAYAFLAMIAMMTLMYLLSKKL